jgi:D-alanyl-D-alanine carboxypeptidase (penicillin-binding protein 5/6)
MDDERFIIDQEAEYQEVDEPTVKRFPVRTQLVFIALLLTVIFAGVIVPQTKNLLSSTGEHVESLPNNYIKETAPTATKLDNIKIYGESAFVFDVASGEVLYEKNSDEVLPLASITKLMTTLVAYEILEDNANVTISKEAAAQQSGGSLKEGEVFNVRELADFALISSYNSAAYSLATAVGKKLGSGDPEQLFVAAMNIRADELDLESLDYKNPTGLDVSVTEAGAVGSARDVSLLMSYILKNHPNILIPSITPYTRLYNKAGDFHEAHNTNNIVGDIPNLLGSKTGFTDLAGGNLTIVFDAGYNRPIVVTVLGSTRSERFSDVNTLVKAVLANTSHQE